VPVTVTELAIAPVKGMRLMAVDELELTEYGPLGDRAFMVVEPDGKLVNTMRTPELMQVEPRFDPASGELALRFPGGDEAVAMPGGEPASTKLYNGREVTGRLLAGPPSDALSTHLGRDVRLLALDHAQTGADDFPVTLMSTASLTALGAALGDSVPDARRFRMTIAVDGLGAWEEHGWAGSEIAVGEVGLRVTDPVPRCAVTTRDPENGRTDLPVLRALAELRGKDDVTFGVWCAVTRPGHVSRGDAVTADAPPSSARGH
jgi:uncharacterized protein YcbX